MSVKALISTLPVDAPETTDIDVTHCFPNAEAGQKIRFVFTCPSTADLTDIPRVAKQIETQRPQWPADFRQSLAMFIIAYSHAVATDAEGKEEEERFDPLQKWILLTDWAAAVGQNDPMAFPAIMNQFLEAFPKLKGVKEAARETKNE